MAYWETKNIFQVVDDIDNNVFVLPVIQRHLVWAESKMELLFDTLLKGNSFGGIVVIEEEKGERPLFEYRPFMKEGEFIPSTKTGLLNKNQFFVIDGQQRLQTFYIGLRGSFKGKTLYFDLFSDPNSGFDFKFGNDISNLPKDNNERSIQNRLWYPVKELTIKLKKTHDAILVAKRITEDKNITQDSEKDSILKNVMAFLVNVFVHPTIGISVVTVDKSLPESELDNKQKIVELFRRLNDGGTRLSSFDLVASILKGHAMEMEGFLMKILDEYQSIGLSQEHLLKLVFLLQDNHKKEITTIDESDAVFAIKYQDRIKIVLALCVKFLDCSGLLKYYNNRNRSFVPLHFIAYHLFHKNIDNNSLSHFFDDYETGNTDAPLMKKWLFNSLVNGVFKSRGAGWVPYTTGIRKILEVIKNHKNKPFPTNELFDVYVSYRIKFRLNYTTEDIDQLDEDFIFYLMYGLSYPNRINDVDHVMPKSILNNLGYSQETIYSIKNYQLLDFITNREIKWSKPFSQWVNEDVVDKFSYITTHLIPNDESLWDEKMFETFIEKRAELILEKILEYTK